MIPGGILVNEARECLPTLKAHLPMLSFAEIEAGQRKE
jgi:hypothetical protein